MKISKVNAKARISLLKEEILRHNALYYAHNQPVISDFEYDLLMQELIALERMFPQFKLADSPTLRVGSDLKKEESDRSFKQVQHSIPMLSLSNTYNKAELYSFNERLAKLSTMPISYVCELKIDGSAISLTYNNGKLIRAVTRGDGSIGDDVTENIRKIGSIPQSLPVEAYSGQFEIRGEVYMSWNSFYRVNNLRKEQGEPLFANPRNAAAGSLKLLDASLIEERGLDVFFYSLHCEELGLNSHLESLQWAAERGFTISNHYRLCDSIEEIMEYLLYWERERDKLDYPTDGVVIKANQFAIQKTAGATSKSPRWATAYKFKAEQAETILESIVYQVGRTGAITPVANLKPVLLSGSVVKRASLHNEEQMRLLDIHIGDRVYIEKGGEIIPKIVGVDSSKRDSNAVVPLYPEFCPECSAKLIKEESESRHYCPNSSGCPMQIMGKFLHFCSRKAMNILAGEATIEQMYKKGMITTLPDLYRLSKEQLLTLEGWKERSAERFLESVEASKAVPFHRVLYALGIRHVGESTAKSLTSHFGSINAVAEASIQELLEIEDIGDIVANSITNYFDDSGNQEIVKSLISFGLRFTEESKKENLSQKLSGFTFVVSGLFSLSREEIKKIIEQHSGKNVSSISKSTTYLLAGEKLGAAKEKRAKELGVEILSESQFLNMIK